MLLAALAKSRVLPYCCVRNATGLVFAAAVEHDPHKTHLELVVGEGCHGVRELKDDDVKLIMDQAGVEFASTLAACEFLAELLIKGKLSCPSATSTAAEFGITVCLGDVSLVLSGFKPMHSPDHVAVLRKLVLPLQPHRTLAAPSPVASSPVPAPAQTQAMGSASLELNQMLTADTAATIRDRKPKALEQVVVQGKGRKKMRA